MNANDTVPSRSPSSGSDVGAAYSESDELWPTNGPAKGLRVRLPLAIGALAVVALVGVAAGAALKNPSSTSTQGGAVAGANRGPGNLPASGAPSGNGATGGIGGRQGGAGGGIVGTVSKVDGNTITVAQADGSTATVVVASDAAITKTVSGSLSDLTNGTSIIVRGTTADGKTTADSVTINPANGAGGSPTGGFPGGGFGGRNPRGTGTGAAGNGQ